MRREVSRFGHAARVWLVFWAASTILPLWLAVSDWRDAIALFALLSVLFGLNVWIQMSQRVWYDDQQVCTRVLGGKRQECIQYSDIQSISASHSWKRAAAQRPISELQIEAHDGRRILISLRHMSLPGLQQMLDEIHRRTDLAVPEVRKFVI